MYEESVKLGFALTYKKNFISDNGNVSLKTYDETPEGFIQSWLDRFPSTATSENLIKLWEKDIKHFSK